MNAYRRSDDGAVMVEIAPNNAVNLKAARALGLIAPNERVVVVDDVPHAAAVDKSDEAFARTQHWRL